MKPRDIIALIFCGFIFWVLGTIFYRNRGPAVFETTSLRYWLNFVITPIASALACIAIFHWLAIPTAAWSSAALLIAIPGMIGEAVLLSSFSRWMPTLRESSAGPYGGFLFAVYALVLCVAEIITLRATS